MRGLLPYLWERPVIALWMVATGLLVSLSEGVGISLFIPFVHTLNRDPGAVPSGGRLETILDSVASLAPAEQRLAWLAAGILSFIVLRNVLAYRRGLLYSRFDADLSNDLRMRTMDSLMRVGVSWVEETESGRLLNTVETQTYEVTGALQTVTQAAVHVGTIGIFTTLMLMISWPLTLLVLLGLTSISVAVQWVARRADRHADDAVFADERLSQRLLETFRGMRTIRAFGRETYEMGRMQTASQDVSQANLALDRLQVMIGPLSELMAATLLVATLLTTATHPSSLPAVLAFIFILYRLHPHVMMLDDARLELVAAGPALRAVDAVLEREGKPFSASGAVEFPGLNSGIRFEGVGFRYGRGNEPALEGIHVYLPAGRTTALVGPSGSGKSTFVNLVLRLYDPTEGRILVDGVPLDNVDLQSWRSRIAVVSQEIHLFNESVRENIRYGRLDATHPEIEWAARQADAHGFVKALEAGYDTVVGDAGVRLSAGQRQRIALARAILRDPDILILDEATNALDGLSEGSIQRALARFARGRTVLVIAHRLHSVENADQILVLDHGQLVETGTRDELLDNEALFRSLYETQQGATFG